MAGLGGGDGDVDRLQIAEFADGDHVGILPEGGAQGGGERLGMCADLPLGDDALGGGEDVLDGVLDGDDVIAASAVHLIREGGEGGGLAGVGRACDEDEAVVEGEEAAEDLDVGVPEIVEGASLRRHDAVGAGDTPFVDRDTGAEALAVAEGERELEVGGFLEFVELFLVEQGEVRGLGDIGRERFLRDVVDLSVLTNEGAGLGTEVEVADPGGLAVGEES